MDLHPKHKGVDLRGQRPARPARRVDGAVHKRHAPAVSTKKTVRKSLTYRTRKAARAATRSWVCRVANFRARHAMCSVDGVRLQRDPSFYGRTMRLMANQQWGRFSLVGVFVLGMASMLFVSQNFGQSASAGRVAGAATESLGSGDMSVSKEHELSEADTHLFYDLLDDFEEQEHFETRLREMVKGYPIEQMIPFIAKQDRLVATFLVSIAKKESNWGKRVPVLNGEDCFNYWGYRGIRERMGTGGHTCFDSREDAVETVAARIKKLVEQEQLNTPSKMVVWKCGYSCEGHSRESVRKWIADVSMYFQTLNREDDDSLTSGAGLTDNGRAGA